MRNRHQIVAGVLLAIVTAVAPAAAQDGASPAPSATPAISGGPAASPDASNPVEPGPRWSLVTARTVRRAGMLDHAVTLGAEVIALAPKTGRDGQTRLRVLATGDGRAWVRRGSIPLTGDVADLLADGTSLYAVGWDERATIWRSDDAGRTWVAPADTAPFAGGADGLAGLDESAEVAAITRGPAGLLAVGVAVDPDTLERRAAAWRSTDGLVWERLAAVGALPPFRAAAADAATYVVVGSSSGAATSPPGADASILRWSTDGVTWTDAAAEIGSSAVIDGITAVPGRGFIAWGSPVQGVGAAVWWSADGRTWEGGPADPALAGADLVSVRSLELGALVIAVGGAPSGAFAFPLVGDAWRRDRIRTRQVLCVRDVASVGAVLIAVGGTCGGPRQRGRAWTTPLEP